MSWMSGNRTLPEILEACVWVLVGISIDMVTLADNAIRSLRSEVATTFVRRGRG